MTQSELMLVNSAFGSGEFASSCFLRRNGKMTTPIKEDECKDGTTPNPDFEATVV
jgi:hypothetical protein